MAASKKAILFGSEMMRAEGSLISIPILIIDVVAGLLAIEAEIAQNQEKHLRRWGILYACRVPSHEAYKLAAIAAALLALAHTVANLVGGCVCIRSKDELDRSSANKLLAFVALILSWSVAVAAFTVLLIGAIANSKPRSTCGFGQRHALSAGGILCFVHGLLMVVFCVSALAMRREDANTSRREIASQPV